MKKDRKSKFVECMGKKKTKGKICRMILLFVGTVLLLWFMVPFVTVGILNIGNVTGMLLSVAFMVYVGFMPMIHGFIYKCRKKRCVKPWLTLAGGIMLLCVFLAVVETGCMIGACANAPKENATAVVLGCKVNGEKASRMLRERLDAALDYLEENPDAVCVVSGGQGSDEGISEAECMFRYLTEKGIAAERIYKEDKSTSTKENMKFSMEVIEENGLREDVAIISNEFHLYRAGMVAKECGMNYGTKPAATDIGLLPTYYVRELYAILAEWVF